MRKRVVLKRFCSLFFGIPPKNVLEQISKRSKVIVAFCTVHAVIDGYVSDIFFDKVDFCIVADFQIIAPQAAHIFDDDSFYFSTLNFGNHTVEIRSVECNTGDSVINKKLRIGKPMVLCIF